MYVPVRNQMHTFVPDRDQVYMSVPDQVGMLGLELMSMDVADFLASSLAQDPVQMLVWGQLRTVILDFQKSMRVLSWRTRLLVWGQLRTVILDVQKSMRVLSCRTRLLVPGSLLLANAGSWSQARRSRLVKLLDDSEAEEDCGGCPWNGWPRVRNHVAALCLSWTATDSSLYQAGPSWESSASFQACSSWSAKAYQDGAVVRCTWALAPSCVP
jgi:hypothetical protein